MVICEPKKPTPIINFMLNGAGQKKPANSGVFVHAQVPDTVWLKCIECQLKAGNAGDFVCMNGADMNERKDKSKPFS